MFKNKIGLVTGLFFGLFHAVWSICVAVMPGAVQSFMNWVLVLHHISIPFVVITPFVLSNAIMLVALTFVMGYVVGWVLGCIGDMVMKKRK